MWLRLTKDTGETTIINMDKVTDFSRAPGDSVTKIRTTTAKGDGLHIIAVKEETDTILGMVQP